MYHHSKSLIFNSSSNSKLNLPVLHFTSSVLELQCFILSWLYRLSIEHAIGRVKTPNVKHPLCNLDMVTRKCLATNSSIYWIVANIPGRGTLTKPRLELTSAPNQHRRKLFCSFSVPFIHKVRHEETECLFEVILYSELLDGNISACRICYGNNEGSDFSLSLCYNNFTLLVWM